MSIRARALLNRMMRELRLSQFDFAQLVGRAERTVCSHANEGKIPLTFAQWLLRVESITVDRDGAVIVLKFPLYRKRAEYRRDVPKK